MGYLKSSWEVWETFAKKISICWASRAGGLFGPFFMGDTLNTLNGDRYLSMLKTHVLPMFFDESDRYILCNELLYSRKLGHHYKEAESLHKLTSSSRKSASSTVKFCEGSYQRSVALGSGHSEWWWLHWTLSDRKHLNRNGLLYTKDGSNSEPPLLYTK